MPLILFLTLLKSIFFPSLSQAVSNAKSEKIITILSFSWCEPCRRDLEILFNDSELKSNSFLVIANPNFKGFLENEIKKFPKTDIIVTYLPDIYDKPNMKVFKQLTREFNSFYQANEDIIGPGYLFVLNKKNSLKYRIPKNTNLNQNEFKKWELSHLKKYLSQ